MDSLIFVVLVALAAGVSAGFQTPLNALAASRVGLLESAFLPHIIGTFTALLPLLLLNSKGLRNIGSVPWYAFLPGMLGVALVMGLSFATPRLGVTGTLVLFVVAQMIVGALIGHFGWLGTPLKPLDISKALGIGLLLAGAWLVVKN